MQISEITQMDFANWIVHFARKGWFGKLNCPFCKKRLISQLHSQLEDDFITWFATWRWFRTLVRNLKMISQRGSQLRRWNFNLWSGTRVLVGGFAATKYLVKFSQVDFATAKFSQLISQLRNFRLTLHDCLQTTITSSFQLWYAHCLKRWTPDFPIFETILSMYKMNSTKWSKCVLQFLSS